MIKVLSRHIDAEKAERMLIGCEQAECPVIHSFGPGLYIRELRMKAGTLAIGHKQKFEHMNIFLKGKVLMLNDDGTKTEFTAPMMFVGPPGRKIGYVLEDVVWLNVYATDETDVETLERKYFEKTEAWEDGALQEKKQIRADDIEDYKSLISDMGLTESEVRNQTENKSDQIPMPHGSFKIAISNSDIEGRGVFATAEINKGETIAPARIGGKRTPVGRYTNHSISPNAKMEFMGDNIYLIALNRIEGCRGGILGEEITTNYRENVKLIGGQSCQE